MLQKLRNFPPPQANIPPPHISHHKGGYRGGGVGEGKKGEKKKEICITQICNTINSENSPPQVFLGEPLKCPQHGAFIGTRVLNGNVNDF